MSERIRASRDHAKPISTDAIESAPRQSVASDAELEALLDEIDAALEPNAEEFVRGYVQKGGE